ncbi:hypothetical protein D3C76_773240 [compost metagenome]
MPDAIQIERERGLLTLRLNRPDKPLRGLARDEASPGNTSSGSKIKKPRHSHGRAFVFQGISPFATARMTTVSSLNSTAKKALLSLMAEEYKPMFTASL